MSFSFILCLWIKRFSQIVESRHRAAADRRYWNHHPHFRPEPIHIFIVIARRWIRRREECNPTMTCLIRRWRDVVRSATKDAFLAIHVVRRKGERGDAAAKAMMPVCGMEAQFASHPVGQLCSTIRGKKKAREVGISPSHWCIGHQQKDRFIHNADLSGSLLYTTHGRW